MIAQHPVTGKNVRIIQTDASIWKERKTLTYALPTNTDKTDSVFTSGSPTFLLQLKDTTAEAIRASTKSSLIVFMKKGCYDDSLEPIKNTIFLDDIHEAYPHIGGPWDGSAEDAAVIVAGIVGFRVISGVWNERAAVLGLQKPTAPPFRLWWVTQYYTPTNKARSKEIRTCFERNCASNLIDRIVLLNEKPEGADITSSHVKVEERVIGKRLSYADVIRAAAAFPPDVVVAFANADICIDDQSWRALWTANLENKFLALLRYDVPKSGLVGDATIFGPRADSQDTWVVRAADIQARDWEKVAASVDFLFGRMGCDNALALQMLRHRFTVVNPCLTLKTWHFHGSEVRTYDKKDLVESDAFHYIHPSGIHDLQPLLTIPREAVMGTFKPGALHRPLRGGGATNWLSSYNRSLEIGEAQFKLENNNTVIPSEEFVLSVKDCFQSPLGIIYDKNHMYIGKSAKSQEIWSGAVMSAMTQTMESARTLVAPWPAGAGESREVFVLKYLSKILQLVPEGPQAIVSGGWEFFCAEKREIIEAMESFRWATHKLPVIKHEEDIVVWSKESRVMMPSDNAAVLAEDVEVLRKNLKGWSGEIGKRLRIVLVEDGTVITSDLVNVLEEVLEKAFEVRVVYTKRTSVYRMADVFSGAWGAVCAGGFEATAWNWMMPSGAFVFEVPGTTAVSAAGITLSAAAGLEHRFCRPFAAASQPEQKATKIFEEVWREEELWKGNVAASDDSTIPTIIMPRRDLEGYFSHPGDSFREMVRLWANAGYCRVKEHALATMVWWGEMGAGGVLLYDRPNHDWRLAAPLLEKHWKFALFGNPKPPSSSTKAAPWFFWPRRPAFVEELAPFVEGWAARKPGLVFYGKIENKVQEKRRKSDWEGACSEWVMVKGEEKYPFTQREYLEKLAEARFGLCLAGYGFKCHREVECMAMGCVPVCAPEVDMDSYAQPPVAGVHYLRAGTPEEALDLIEAMDEATWTKMSLAGRAWWKENCSCEGSFKLTQKLVVG